MIPLLRKYCLEHHLSDSRPTTSWANRDLYATFIYRIVAVPICVVRSSSTRLKERYSYFLSMFPLSGTSQQHPPLIVRWGKSTVYARDSATDGGYFNVDAPSWGSATYNIAFYCRGACGQKQTSAMRVYHGCCHSSRRLHRTNLQTETRQI